MDAKGGLSVTCLKMAGNNGNIKAYLSLLKMPLSCPCWTNIFKLSKIKQQKFGNDNNLCLFTTIFASV